IGCWFAVGVAGEGRAYFGFGAGAGGTLSIVAAPNTGQLIIQKNGNFGCTNLASVSQTYKANHWYRLEVDWGTSGKIVGKLFDSNGTTLLKSVSATTTAIKSGGIAFRAIGTYDKYFDAVTASYGVNSFALSGATDPGSLADSTDSSFPPLLVQGQVFAGAPTVNLSAPARADADSNSHSDGQAQVFSPQTVDSYFADYTQSQRAA